MFQACGSATRIAHFSFSCCHKNTADFSLKTKNTNPMYIYIYMHTCLLTCNILTYKHMHIHTLYAYIRTYTHMHTYIHTYIHPYVHRQLPLNLGQQCYEPSIENYNNYHSCNFEYACCKANVPVAPDFHELILRFSILLFRHVK